MSTKLSLVILSFCKYKAEGVRTEVIYLAELEFQSMSFNAMIFQRCLHRIQNHFL